MSVSQRKRNQPKTSYTGFLNDLMFSWESKWKSSIQVWDDLFGNLVDISSDPYDDDMFTKSFAKLICNCLPWQGKPGEDGPTGPSGEEGDKVIAPEIYILFLRQLQRDINSCSEEGGIHLIIHLSFIPRIIHPPFIYGFTSPLVDGMGVSPQESNKCTPNVWYVNSDENWLTEGYNWIDPMFWRRALSIVLSFRERPAVISLKNRCVALSFLHFFSIVFEERMRSSYKWASHFILPSDYCGIFTFSRVHKELQEYLARKEIEGPRWLTWMVIQFGNFWRGLIFFRLSSKTDH